MRIVPPATPVRPSCHNRPAPETRTYVRHGIDQQTGEAIAVEIDGSWASLDCASWAGRGIGSTPETTHYPQARGWAEFCKTCRWLPEEGKAAMGITDNNEGK